MSLAWWGVLLGLAGPGNAGEADDIVAGPVPLEVTSTTLGGWHSGTAGYGELFERLNVAGGFEAWRLGLRLDTATFARASSPAIADRYTLEKASIAWTGRSIELVAGDAYVSFGRGLALSLRKIDELGVDTTLRGAKVLVHRGRLGGTLVAGYTNPNNVDEASGKSIDDPRDLIAGLRLDGSVGAGVTLGAHATVVAFRRPLGLSPGGSYQDRYLQVGPTLDAPSLTSWLGIYLEGIGQVRRTAAPGSALGFGAYGSATVYAGRATVLVEGKAYGALEPIKPQVPRAEFSTVAYNNPPTVERLAQRLENPQKDVAGARLRFDWAFSPSLVGYASYGVFRDWQGYADPAEVGSFRPASIHDPYLGVEARAADGRSWLLASGGWRVVVLDRSGALVRGDAHLEVDATQALVGRWSATAHAELDRRSKNESPLLDQRFTEATFLAAVRLTPWGSLALGHDYTGDPTQPRRHHWNGTLEWNITTSSSLRLLVGGTRGGLRCVSGVCRVFPAFEGVRLTTTIRL
jgi:hypothetical protein